MKSQKSQLDGRVAVVAGGSGYVGSAVAKRLAKSGMKVALLYYSSSQTSVDELLSKFPGSGHRAFRCDLANAHDVQEAIQRVESELGDLFVSVYAAGVAPSRKPLYSASEAELREQLEGNAVSAFLFLSECAKKLKARSEGILIGITTSAVAKPEAARSLGAYGAAKYALQGILAVLKEELTSSGVHVFSVAPGFMPYGMNRDIPKAFVEIARQKSPTKKLAAAEDVAEAVLQLVENPENAPFTTLVAPETE